MSKKPKDIALAMKKRKVAAKKRSTKAFDWYEKARNRFSIAAKRPEIRDDFDESSGP
jgi:hypothetical protein